MVELAGCVYHLKFCRSSEFLWKELSNSFLVVFSFIMLWTEPVLVFEICHDMCNPLQRAILHFLKLSIYSWWTLYFGLLYAFDFLCSCSLDFRCSNCGTFEHCLSHKVWCWEYVVTTCRVPSDAPQGRCKLKLLCPPCSSRPVLRFQDWRPQPLAAIILCADIWNCWYTPWYDII